MYPFAQKKSRICLKKKKNVEERHLSQSKSQLKNGGKLAINDNDLLEKVKMLRAKLKMAEIDRDHYFRELEISIQRQR